MWDSTDWRAMNMGQVNDGESRTQLLKAQQQVEWSIGPFTVGDATLSSSSVTAGGSIYSYSSPSVYNDLHSHVTTNVSLLLLGVAFFICFTCGVVRVLASGQRGRSSSCSAASLAVDLVDFLAWSTDLLVGGVLFVVLFVLSFAGVMDSVHTMLLYGTKVSRWKKM